MEAQGPERTELYPGTSRSPDRAAIWWGDAARVFAALRPDPAAAGRVLALLGLSPGRAASPPGPAPAPPAPPPTPFPLAATVTGGPTRPTGPTARDLAWDVDFGSDPVLDAEGSAPPRVAVVRSLGMPPPHPLPPDLDVLLSAPPAGGTTAPTDAGTLLTPSRQRAILTPLCSGPATTGDPDVDAAVETVARGEPLLTLPRRVVFTTRRGLQVLVDHSPAMLPFARDQDEVLASVRSVTGPDGLEVLHFAGTPLDEPGAGTGPLWTWKFYRPPMSGIPVLVLSDLGCVAAVTARARVVTRWERFAAVLHEAGCPLVALVPAPLSRVDARLRRKIAVVSWDRPTSVRQAVGAVRRAGGRVQERSP